VSQQAVKSLDAVGKFSPSLIVRRYRLVDSLMLQNQSLDSCA
jgi:hypothetical protein